MPTLINATYYNLVNNILLSRRHIKVYLNYLIKSNFNNTNTITYNPKNVMVMIDLNIRSNNGILPYLSPNTGSTFNAINFNIDIGTNRTLYDLVYYLRYLLYYDYINKAQFNTLKRVLLRNTYNVRHLIAEKMRITYITKYIMPPISKNIAINKIKRNAIYNHGLGLKLAVREYSKDF
jgi:hypothetical protein